jgi:CDP-diacylglycerol--serine O-phosphatidyltransferase
MIFDFLDGFSARLLKAYSDIGKELDSLADVVSFGVAPGLIIFHLLMSSCSADKQILLSSPQLKTISLLLISAIMPVCGALRLAVFNLDSSQATTFKGLPVPANAIAVISLVLAGHFAQSPIIEYLTGSVLPLVILTLILSLLMVSRIPLLSLKINSLRLKGNEGRYILAGLVLIGFAVLGPMVLPLIIPFYLVSSALSLLF